MAATRSTAYQYVFGSFQDNLLLSVQMTVLTIVINLLIAIPAAYAIVRYAAAGQELHPLDAQSLALHAGRGDGA